MIRANFRSLWPRFARLDYYTTSSTVCQEVFEKFFEFFSRTFLNRFSAGEEVPEYYITSSRVCQEVFQKFFQLFFVFLFSGSLSRLPARGQLAYYSTFGFICQQVFAKFFEFGEGGRCVQKEGIAFVHNAQ